MILFFDTETTGLPQAHLSNADPLQPHVVQLAALLTDDDGTERASLNLVVQPDTPIPAPAAAVHGITDEIAARCGVRPAVAAVAFCDLMRRADTLVAHNISFDLQLIATLLLRTRREQPVMPSTFCTMIAASPIVNLPPTARMVSAGFNKPKPPKLEECIAHFFGEKLDGAHDAMIDVRACARLFFHLRDQAPTAAVSA
jgi:DNA polymerase-3 subunit epsilon